MREVGTAQPPGLGSCQDEVTGLVPGAFPLHPTGTKPLEREAQTLTLGLPLPARGHVPGKLPEKVGPMSFHINL